MSDTGHGRALTNRVPATSSGQPPHVLDGTCWCKPTATTDRGRSTLVHHADAPDWRDEAKLHLRRIHDGVLAELAQVVRTPPKRSRWARPWGRR